MKTKKWLQGNGDFMTIWQMCDRKPKTLVGKEEIASALNGSINSQKAHTIFVALWTAIDYLLTTPWRLIKLFL